MGRPAIGSNGTACPAGTGASRRSAGSLSTSRSCHQIAKNFDPVRRPREPNMLPTLTGPPSIRATSPAQSVMARSAGVDDVEALGEPSLRQAEAARRLAHPAGHEALQLPLGLVADLGDVARQRGELALDEVGDVDGGGGWRAGGRVSSPGWSARGLPPSHTSDTVHASSPSSARSSGKANGLRA